MAEGDGEAHLKPEEIRFLALEGGGGKGFAYLGAIQVLEEKGVMAHVEGVSGTSAGAITALMLSLGLGAADIQDQLANNDFNKFFDPPTEGGPVQSGGTRLVPRPGGYVEQPTTKCELTMLKGWDPAATAASATRSFLRAPSPISIPALVVGALQGALGPLLDCLRGKDGEPKTSALGKLLQAYAWLLSGPGRLNTRIAEVLKIYLLALHPDARAVLDALWGRMPEYFTFFDRDMGMFSGKAARDYFATLIRNRLVEKLGQAEADKYPDLTFGQFHDIKADLGAMDLLVCGANLSIGRSVLFSWRHTPDFPVADAVRISMSLPGIYKPYLVTEQRTGWPPCGTYVDGGLWNNLPFREIGALAAEAPQAPPAAGGGQGTGQGAGQEVPRDIQAELRSLNAALNERATLGLRLEIVPPETVFTGQDVLFKSFMVAGETRLLPDIEPFTLILDTRRLSLLQFNPPPDVSAVVTRRSRRAMLSYFGETSEMIPSDAADERESEALRATSLCTGPSGETFLRPPDYSNRASPPLQGGRFTGF